MAICPFCHAQNVAGVDDCESCGASLTHLSMPEPATAVEAALLRDRVDCLAEHPPVTVKPDDPAGDVVQRMVDKRVGCVLIVDQQGKLTGIFSERDALMKLNAQSTQLRDKPIRDFATSDPETIEADAKIAFALHRMHVGGYRHLPVLDGDGKPISVISIRDLLAYLTERSGDVI